MKYILSIVFLALIIIGCQKKDTVKIKITKPIEVKVIEQKKIVPVVKKEVITKKVVIKKIVEPIKEIITPVVKEVEKEHIAIVYASKKIGKYAIEATNSAMVYMLNNKDEFSLSVFDIENENVDSIYGVLNQLKDRNISKVLFMITPHSADLLYSYESLDKFKIYLPLINKMQTNSTSENIVFGGINYNDQFEVLLSQENTHIVEIYDDSSIGKSLHNNLLKLNKDIKSYKLSSKHTNFTSFFEKNKNISNATLILNTPIIRSSIILSQLRANEIEVNKILSTQINYTPLLLVLTQKEDREHLIIANFIDLLPNDLEAINILLGNDILYNWVNYSVVLGMEYLKTNSNLLFDNVMIDDNQVQYKLKLLTSKEFGFTHY